MGRLAPEPDECLHCADHWDNQFPPKPRQKLVFVGTTQNKKVQVSLCPYCDGERAIELAQGRNS